MDNRKSVQQIQGLWWNRSAIWERASEIENWTGWRSCCPNILFPQIHRITIAKARQKAACPLWKWNSNRFPYKNSDCVWDKKQIGVDSVRKRSTIRHYGRRRTSMHTKRFLFIGAYALIWFAMIFGLNWLLCSWIFLHRSRKNVFGMDWATRYSKLIFKQSYYWIDP